MKNKILTILSLFIMLSSSFKTKAQDMVGSTIEITEGVMNLFLNEQYNRAGFPRNINGNIEGVTYDITLHLPEIRLLDNEAKIEFGFKIESNVFNGYVEFEDNIALFIPSIEELTVKGISNAFKEKVNSLDIHALLKVVIIAAWESLELEVYPMELAKKVENSEWLVERSISVFDPYFSISLDVDPGKLKIGLNTYLEGREYLVAGLFKENDQWWLKIGAGCQVNVKEVFIYNSSGQQIRHGVDLGICPKKGGLSIPIGGTFPYNYYTIKILYTTSNTFYVRGYKNVPGGYISPNDILN